MNLRDSLEQEGIDIRTRSADIAIVQSLDRSLSIVFWVIAAVALSGYSLSLGTSLWANVDRKRRELSVLRLVGFRTISIIWFPVLQASFTGILGWSVASVIYISVEQALNQLFHTGSEFSESVCKLLPVHFLWASVFTIASCVVASALGGYRVSRIEPSEGVRDI
jgi:putative ABC transport system permease protein